MLTGLEHEHVLMGLDYLHMLMVHAHEYKLMGQSL